MSNINAAKKKGIEQGEKKGRKDIAKKLKDRGMKIEEIMEITRLNRKEIENL